MKTISTLLTIVTTFALFAGHTDAADRPNVVIFLADDAGWGDYSHSGNRQVSTPHIDSIAEGGVSLDRFFVCPVCSPTRAEFLTGRYHPRGGVRGVSTGQERLNIDVKTIADDFRAAGYATGAFGKWHNGSQWPYHPNARGFDQYFGYTSGHWGEYVDPPLEENGKQIRAKGYIVDICTDRAIDFIEANAKQPFFCYVPFTTPHSPWSVPREDWDRFRDRPLAQRASPGQEESLDETRCVLAMIENQDRNVGKVLSKLRELQLDDNTIVLYFSDNGPNTWRWNGGMRGKKGGTDEGSVRSVCYLRWPKRIPAGQVVTPIAGAIDLLPTLTGLANVRHTDDQPLDGRDLSPLLVHQTTEWADRYLFTSWAGKISVRTERYRLDDQGRLYDMSVDPGQTVPINSAVPTVAKELADAANKWRKDVLELASTKQESIELEAQLAAHGIKPQKRISIDARPLTVGYHEFPITMLPARDGEAFGEVKRSSAAPNSSYFVNWTSKEDTMAWHVDVHTTGRYEAIIEYTCPEADVGSLVELSFGSSRLSHRIEEAWDPPLLSNQDTLPRPAAESTMKVFRPLKLGELDLKRGQGLLTLRASEIPGKTVMDVRQLTLTLLPD